MCNCVKYHTKILKTTLQSSRIGDAIARSNWDCFNVTTRRGLIIILTYAKNPIQLIGMKINKLNVDQFQTVMTTTFSYYTLLKKMKERN